LGIVTRVIFLPKNQKLKINRLIMRWDLNSLLLLFMKLFINVRKESNLTLLNVPQLKNTDMIWRSYGRFFIYLTDKVDEPEKTTGIVPSM